MKWSDVYVKLADFYSQVANYAFDHPVEVETVTVAVIVGSLVVYLRGQRRRRSRAHRLIRGAIMKRRDQEAYFRMQFEDAIVDKAMEMVHRGEMTPRQEQEYYELFAHSYGMTGLLPMRNAEALKRGIKMRLHMAPDTRPKIPGGRAVVAVDKTYEPTSNVVPIKGSKKSRYAA